MLDVLAESLPNEAALGERVDGSRVLDDVGTDDAVLAQLYQRVRSSGNVALDPPLCDSARSVRRLVVTDEIVDDVSTDVVTLEQLANSFGSDVLRSDCRPPFCAAIYNRSEAIQSTSQKGCDGADP